MDVALWVKAAAAAFWGEVGPPGPFPRSFHKPARSLRLSLVERPRLRLTTAVRWFEEQGIACPLNAADRPLHACLIVCDGEGFVFLDNTDDLDEQRFSLAHEIAHFLRDYREPRQWAVRRLGPAILEVLDGKRPPTPSERFRGALRDVPLGFHTHLLTREAERLPAAVAHAEDDADRLAFELLAPTEAIPAALAGAELIRRLREDFGLPESPALRYAELLRPAPPSPDPLLERLKIGKKLSHPVRDAGTTGGGSDG